MKPQELLTAFAKVQAGIEIFLVNQVKDRGWVPDKSAVRQTMEHLISGAEVDSLVKEKCEVLIEFLKADEQILSLFCAAIRIKIKCMMQEGLGGEGFKITKNLKSHGIRAVSIDSAVPSPEEFLQLANNFVLRVNTIDAQSVKVDENWASRQWTGNVPSIGDIPTEAGAGSRVSQPSAGMKAPISIGDMRTVASSRQPDIEAALPKSLIGRYRISELLGEGGFGQVFKVHDTVLDRTVALKSFKRGVLTERLLREARAAAKLNHPSIVQVYDVLESEGELFIVMEFVEGLSLRELLRKQEKSTLEQALSIISQICDAMECAHKNGIVHRDIKPENILCSSDLTQIKVADFGLARLDAEFSLSVTGNMSGTILYMAPEQMKDAKHVDLRADVFSIGKLLYEVITGDVPFVIELDRLPDNLILRRLIEKCVKTRPEERIQNVTEISNTLRDIRKENAHG